MDNVSQKAKVLAKVQLLPLFCSKLPLPAFPGNKVAAEVI